MHIFAFFIILLLSVVFPRYTQSNESVQTLKVDIAIVPPMVMKFDTMYSGFDIELWEAIARELDVTTQYREVPFAQIFDGIKNGDSDAAISGITITEERERLVDFSHHYFDSGLHILVLVPQTSTLRYVWDIFVENKMYKWFLCLFGFIFLFGNVVWFFERKKEHISCRYIPGVFDACWFVIVTMATVGYGDIAPRTWSGRIAASIVMMFGITFFTIATGHLVATMTIERLQHDIQGPGDLEGKHVATLAGTTSADYLREIGAHIHAVPDISDSFALLEKKEVEAIVYDVQVLLYYQRHEKNGNTQIAGPKFDEQYYGIALPQGSPLREPINRALLKLRQNGFYDSHYKKWFGGREK